MQLSTLCTNDWVELIKQMYIDIYEQQIHGIQYAQCCIRFDIYYYYFLIKPNSMYFVRPFHALTVTNEIGLWITWQSEFNTINI